MIYNIIELNKKLKKLNIEWSRYDDLPTPHATIAYADKNFEEAIEFLSKYDPKFELLFDNIAILKHNKVWEVETVYEIS